jgi:hypothetical protein
MAMSTSPCGLLEWVVAIQDAAKIWGAGAEFRVEMLAEIVISRKQFQRNAFQTTKHMRSTEHVG